MSRKSRAWGVFVHISCAWSKSSLNILHIAQNASNKSIEHHGTCRFSWYIFHWLFRQPRWLDPGRAESAPSGWLCPTNRFQVGWVSLTSWVHQEIQDAHAFVLFLSIFLLKKLILPSAPQAQWWSEHQALVHNQTTPRQKPTSQLHFLVRLGDQCLGKHPHADISHVTATPWKRPGCLILERNLHSCLRASSRAALDREKKLAGYSYHTRPGKCICWNALVALNSNLSLNTDHLIIPGRDSSPYHQHSRSHAFLQSRSNLGVETQPEDHRMSETPLTK